MALLSQLFRGDSSLEAAAVSDPAHILPGASGPHVGKIQQALIQLDAAAITKDSIYGPATAAAVAAFKQKRQILNAQGKIDNIVGKKTMAALDSEIRAKEGAGAGGAAGGTARTQLGFSVPAGLLADVVPVLTGPKFMDFVVRFRAGEARDAMANVNRAEYDKKKATRVLVPLTLASTTQNDSALVGGAIATMDLALKAPGVQLGIICVYGNSKGGRNAVEFAAVLTARGSLTPIKFIGIADAALSNDGIVLNTPIRKPGLFDDNLATNVPRWTPPTVTATLKHNFFQNVGNSTKRTAAGVGRLLWDNRSIFRGGISGEFHGEIDGFDATPGGQNLNLPDSTSRPHVVAGDSGDLKNQGTITTLLSALPDNASGQ